MCGNVGVFLFAVSELKFIIIWLQIVAEWISCTDGNENERIISMDADTNINNALMGFDVAIVLIELWCGARTRQSINHIVIVRVLCVSDRRQHAEMHIHLWSSSASHFSRFSSSFAFRIRFSMFIGLHRFAHRWITTGRLELLQTSVWKPLNSIKMITFEMRIFGSKMESNNHFTNNNSFQCLACGRRCVSMN